MQVPTRRRVGGGPNPRNRTSWAGRYKAGPYVAFDHWLPLLVCACLAMACDDDGSSTTTETGTSTATATSGDAMSTTSPDGADISAPGDVTTIADGTSGDATPGDATPDGDAVVIPPSDAWYTGIPYPTDSLPAGIMPTLPTPGAQPGWPYDPIEIALPEPTGASDEWVVAVDGDDGSAGNGGQGTLDQPRRTIPEGPFGAGTKVFVVGQNSPYGTVDFDFGELEISFECTAAAPCFWVGIDGPRLGWRINLADSAHLVIDGLHINDTPDGNRPYGAMRLSDSSYITTRNMEFRGSGENSRGGAVFQMSGVEFLMSYRITMRDAGSWESNATGLDVHGWRPAYDNRYLWLIDSEIYHMQADSIQIGNSSNPNPQASTTHYVYIAGNTFYENYENALDNKNSYHVIFAENDVHTFFAAPDGGGANSTAIILSNNAEGPWTGYHWAVNNRVWNSGLAIRDSGSEVDEKNYAVGNVIWDVGTSFVQANNAAGRECWIVNNTAVATDSHFDAWQAGGGSASTFVRRNVFVGGELDIAGEIQSELVDNVLFGVDQRGNWDVDQGNLGDDPLLADSDAGDMTPGPGSPAREAMADEDPVFGLFESLYGLSIRRDVAGTDRPAGNWELGAIETAP